MSDQQPVPPRLNLNQRPHTRQLMEEMQTASGLTLTELHAYGIDVLHFVWSIAQSGGSVAVKLPGKDEYRDVVMMVPGLVQPSRGTGQ